MKYIFTIFLLSFAFTVSAQVQTEKWNSYQNRYEYFDSNGNMTAYKKYNSYLQQWETYKVNNSNNGYSPVRSSINTELLDSTLKSRQSRYEENLKTIKETILSNHKFITAVYYGEGYSDSKIYSAIEKYNKEYVNKIINWDFSLTENTENATKYLLKSLLPFLCKEINYCNIK